jgi:Uma2 family endonuclease
MLTQERVYTSQDLWELSQLPENEGKRLYLIDGEIYKMPPAGPLHGATSMKVSAPMTVHVDQHDLGLVFAAETGFDLAPGTTLAPDASFVAAARLPVPLPNQFFPFAPDLAVEVVSPSNRPSAIRKRVEKYLHYGTRLVWVIYPEDRSVDVYRASPEGILVQFLNIDDTLDGGDVLPGFKLPVRDIFPKG